MVTKSFVLTDNLAKKIETGSEAFGMSQSGLVRKVFDLFDFLFKFMVKYMDGKEDIKPTKEDMAKIRFIEALRDWV